MTFLRALIIPLIAVIGVTHTQNLNFREPLDSVKDSVDPEYRPWDHDDTSTVWISLEGMGIGNLNSMFKLNIPNLKWLVMDNNQIQIIKSRAFEVFPNLTYISLAGNQISRFEPDAFDYLEKVEVLDLDRNPIGGGLDSSIFSTMSELKRLFLRNCYLSSFDLPINMEHLSHLYLSGNQLETFKTVNTSSLISLHLDNNQLKYVSLSNFKTLKYLNLGNNRLTGIVRRSTILPVYQSRTLNGRVYYFTSDYEEYVDFPPEVDVSGLYLDDAAAVLQNLIVSSNQLSEMNSDAFLDTKALISVDLSYNQISQVYSGTFNNLLKLENISLESNQMKKIYHRALVNLPNLKTLSLKDNLIDDIDEDAFTKLNSSANEVYLFLDNNNIHTLRRGSFRGIKGLKHIGLSNNRIKTISSQTFVNLPNLESIVIENQSRDENVDHFVRRVTRTGLIESDAFVNLSNIMSITIRGNLFTDIEAQAFHDLPKLTMLDLSNNSISTLSAEAFSDLPVIENLYLGRNSISNIAPDTFPKHLKHLDLAWNRVCPAFSCWHVGDLHQLEELDVSGVIDRFTVEDFTGLPKNLTVIVGKAEAPTAGALEF